MQNEAARRGDDFNLLLLRYGIERLLFRLSQSSYADRFLLKGAMLFVVWDVVVALREYLAPILRG